MHRNSFRTTTGATTPLQIPLSLFLHTLNCRRLTTPSPSPLHCSVPNSHLPPLPLSQNPFRPGCSPDKAPSHHCPRQPVPPSSCSQGVAFRPPTGQRWRLDKKGRREPLSLVEPRVWVGCHSCACDELAAATIKKGKKAYDQYFRSVLLTVYF